ncbi:hypothetical protein KIPB_017050, partial [Kipferlia bialata]|eukprot:g17050.t1
MVVLTRAVLASEVLGQTSSERFVQAYKLISYDPNRMLS